MYLVRPELIKLLKSAALKSLKIKISDEDVSLEHPADPAFGDYSSSLALTLAKQLEQSPMAIANTVAEAVRKEKLYLEKVEVAPPGFINLTLTKEYLLHETARVLTIRELYGCSKARAGQTILLEFAHPNTHKQFHIGHLRNITLGESLARLLKSQGVNLIRANYQGDVGLHVAKALWGLTQVSSIGSQLTKSRKLGLEKKIELLGEAYVEGHKAFAKGGETEAQVAALNKKIYEKDPSIMPLWTETRQWSLDYFDLIYKRLGSHFDRFYFESEVFAKGLTIAREALKSGILKESQGAVVFDGSEYGLDTRVFITGTGLPTYEAKELGLASLEFSEHGPLTKCIHVVAPEQSSFFKVTFKVEELLDPGKYALRQEHFDYGYVDLKEGKMSSRAGNIVTALSLLDSARLKAKELIKDATLTEVEREEVTEKVAVGAVKYSLLRYGARRNISFDLKQSVALEGNSGPYLQYTYARARSVLRKLESAPSLAGFTSASVNLNPEEGAVARLIYRFPEVTKAAAADYAPNVLGDYLYLLAQKFNAFYDKHSILKAAPAEQELRFLLTSAVAQIIKNGLNLLGIEVMEKM
ncbi:MAG: arginine--tRNA ligase [Patescibacteria group bacterium]